MKAAVNKLTYQVYNFLSSPEEAQTITPAQFNQLLKNSTLGERRPVEDQECISGMINNSNLIVSAWDGKNLVGISRCVTDFHYCCYLSDLAVDQKYQNQGVGKQLQVLTQQQLGPRCKLVLIAAPAVKNYYQKIGFTNNERCWVLNREESVNV